MRQHTQTGGYVREHRNTLREAQHARAARRCLQAQLAAGRGPGVGARSPSPPGTASTASGAAGVRHQRAHRRVVSCTSINTNASTHQTAPSPCPAEVTPASRAQKTKKPAQGYLNGLH